MWPKFFRSLNTDIAIHQIVGPYKNAKSDKDLLKLHQLCLLPAVFCTDAYNGTEKQRGLIL